METKLNEYDLWRGNKQEFTDAMVQYPVYAALNILNKNFLGFRVKVHLWVTVCEHIQKVWKVANMNTNLLQSENFY